MVGITQTAKGQAAAAAVEADAFQRGFYWDGVDFAEHEIMQGLKLLLKVCRCVEISCKGCIGHGSHFHRYYIVFV